MSIVVKSVTTQPVIIEHTLGKNQTLGGIRVMPNDLQITVVIGSSSEYIGRVYVYEKSGASHIMQFGYPKVLNEIDFDRVVFYERQ